MPPYLQTHNAAQYCYDLVSNGADDWYLPGRNELVNILIPVGIQVGMIDGTGLGDSYWAADENNNQEAYRRSTSGGGGNNDKETTLNVRCVRKGPAPRCANPYGMEGDVVYNTTHNVLQFCDGARWLGIGKVN